jgi:GTP:adenosylcobinamide-phosphate guanylyltransferase
VAKARCRCLTDSPDRPRLEAGAAPVHPHPWFRLVKPMTNFSAERFTAIVLSADRKIPDPVAQAAGVPCKALAPVGGQAMVLRVLDTLAASASIGTAILCGPPEESMTSSPVLQQRLAAGAVGWRAPSATPSTSAFEALADIPPQSPVLLTTADHALLRPEMVEFFCREARHTGCDVVAGLASYARVKAAYPDMRRTRTRFRDGPFCGCNLYAFLTVQARRAADLWRQVENERKRPLRMIGKLGWGVVLRYLLGVLSLQAALRHVSRRMGVKAGAVILPFPEAAVDVDTVADWRMAEAIACRREPAVRAEG